MNDFYISFIILGVLEGESASSRLGAAQKSTRRSTDFGMAIMVMRTRPPHFLDSRVSAVSQPILRTYAP